MLIDSRMLAVYFGALSLPSFRPHTIQMVARSVGKDVRGVHIPIIR